MLKNSATYQQTKNHYQNLLSQHYTWLFVNGRDAIQTNTALFKDILSQAESSHIETIIDLGCGNGVQSIPLLTLFKSSLQKLFCIDSSLYLLDELRDKVPKDMQAKTVLLEGDLLLFPSLINTSTPAADLIVCMGDTLTHLASLNEVKCLFNQSFEALSENGTLLLQYRDLTKELIGGDRFIPVKSDERTVFTCFLEWTRDTEKDCEVPSSLTSIDLTKDGSGRIIKVHDLVHVKKGIGAWELCTSWYQKLALSPAVCLALLESAGFVRIEYSLGSDGMLIFKAKKDAAVV